LQRRATERASGSMGMNGRARRGTDPEQRPQLEHSASFNGIDNKSRRGQAANNTSLPGLSLLRSSSTAGKGAAEARLSLLSRRNTDAQRPARLNLGSSSNLNHGSPASAAPSIPLPSLPLAPIPTDDIIAVNAAADADARADANAEAAAAALREFYQDDMEDDLDQHVYALSIEAQEITVVDKPSVISSSKALSNTSSTDIRVSPIPTRSNSSASRTGSILRKTSQNSGYSSSASSPPMPSSILPHQHTQTYNSDYADNSPPSRTGTPPVFSDLRRMGSNGKNGATGLWRGDSVRSTTSGGSGGSGGGAGASYFQQQPNHGDHYLGFMNGAEGTYLDEPVYAGLRNK
ncbi:hypothetical protein BG015_006273, partial [Linnemannia schmuckeri]